MRLDLDQAGEPRQAEYCPKCHSHFIPWVTRCECITGQIWKSDVIIEAKKKGMTPLDYVLEYRIPKKILPLVKKSDK